MVNQNSLKRIQKIINTGFTLITGLTPNLGNFKKERMLRLTDLIHLENNKLGYQLEKATLPCNLHDLLWTDSRNKSLQKTHQYNTREKIFQSYQKHLIIGTIKGSNSKVSKIMN